MEDDVVRIFDTTLRDGEQSPGATLTVEEKLEIARQLVRLGVDIIEAGFPIASPGDFEAVRRIAREIGPLGKDRPHGPPVIAGLARANKEDIDACWEAVREAPRPRIHVFLATSDIHLQYKLRMTREECLARIREMVAYARSLCDDVEFSPEDAGRTDRDFLMQALTAAVEAGATTLNIPDTVGYTTPEEFGGLFAEIRRRVPGVERVILSAHCHNDLGLATANTLAAIRNGARQVEVTVNGIGERAGNTALEEVVMALHTRRDVFRVRTHIDTTQIYRTSRLVSALTGIPVQPNKAIVGANAFAHEAGIHQDGMLKNPLTYEIMRPETVGVPESRLVLGKHSGRHAFRVRLEQMGYHLPPDAFEEAFRRFKALCDRKKYVTDFDLEALMADFTQSSGQSWRLDTLQVTCGTPLIATATVRLVGPDGEVRMGTGTGNGPVDAAYRAIEAALGVQARLLEFNVHAVTPGRDAMGRVFVQAEDPQTGTLAGGFGADTDIVVAAAKAYLHALLRLSRAPQTAPVERMSIPVP